MARFDDLTKDFIEKVSGHSLHLDVDSLDVEPQAVSGPRDRTLVEKSISAAKTGIAVAKDPARELPRLVVRGATKNLLLRSGQPALEKKAAAAIPPLQVYRLLNDNYGHSWWDWEPETLWQTFAVEHHVEADDDLKNLVQAMQVLVNTNQVHEHWHIFENAVNALNGNHVDFTVMQPPTPSDIAAAFKVINTIRPDEEFDEEIYTYVAGVCHGEGMVYLPQGLFPKDCQKKLEDITFDRDLERAVAHCWNTNTNSSDERVGIQIAHLNEIKDYVLGQ
jgi:hypothetical protein